MMHVRDNEDTYSKLGGWGEDVGINEAVRVDDEGGTGDGGGTRNERRGLRERSSKDAANGGQRKRGRDGGDHARVGEHRWDVTKNKSEDDERRKSRSADLVMWRMKVRNEVKGGEEPPPQDLQVIYPAAARGGRCAHDAAESRAGSPSARMS